MTTDNTSNNKRIAQNTIFLYVRMLVMMFIGLFTSRIILIALGVSDLGLLNVAGGVVGVFSFLNGTLASGTQRFITFAIGENNKEKLRNVFRTAMTLHGIIAIIIFVLAETVGLWYVQNKLNVDADRYDAALWCYQFSVITVIITVIQVPFMSSLIAHEKMGAFAYMSIFDAVTKLLSAYIIMVTPFDRLIVYAALLLLFSLISTLIYIWYCHRLFEECSFSYGYSGEEFQSMLSFSGWNTFGFLATTGQSYGVNLLINFFCGTAVNGARGIAFQANGWVLKFVENFQMAMNPQIVKYYASGDIQSMGKLVVKGAQLSCYLYLFFGIPLFIEIEWVINLWLGQCPDYVPIFLRIVMIETLFRTMGNPTATAMHALGRMKMLNLTVGGYLLTIVPQCYILFKLGCKVQYVVAAAVIPWLFVPLIRLYWLKKYTANKFPCAQFVIQAMLKTIMLTLIMFAVPFFMESLFHQQGFLSFVIVGFTSVVSSGMIIFFVGLDKITRRKVENKIKMIIAKAMSKNESDMR